MTELAECVACGSSRWDPEEEWQGFRIVRCQECGLSFTRNPVYRPERYRDVYDHQSTTVVPEEHAYVYAAPGERLRLETIAVILPPPRLRPAEREALAWIKRHAPRGAMIIDCGCGSGRFLRALKHHGLRGIGVEISQNVVDALNRSGLTAISGKAPDFEWSGDPPFAITFFEVLEHIAEPVPMLTTLRKRFPAAFILASVPSPLRPGLLFKGNRGLSDYPPNHFLRWTPDALKQAFLRSGYSQVTVMLPPPVGSEMLPGLGQVLHGVRRKAGERSAARGTRTLNDRRARVLMRVGATAALCALWLYQQAADFAGYPQAWAARRRGASAASMLVVAEP